MPPRIYVEALSAEPGNGNNEIGNKESSFIRMYRGKELATFVTFKISTLVPLKGNTKCAPCSGGDPATGVPLGVHLFPGHQVISGGYNVGRASRVH